MPSLTVNGTEIYYEIRGEGEPVVFLNGVMMTTQSWGLQTKELARRYRCVLHDLRGQLKSAKPEGPYTMELHADDLAALLDALDLERVHLVGTSYGGEVGLIFAAAHPRRVRSLAVISTVGRVSNLLRRKVDLWAETALRDPQKLYDLAAPFNFSNRFLEQNPGVVGLGRARLAEAPAEFFPAFARLVEAFRGLDVSDRLADIRCPTLVMCGEEDALKPVAESRFIARRIPGAEMLIVPGAGHALVIEKPGEVNTALLGFLARHGDRRATPPRRPTPAAAPGPRAWRAPGLRSGTAC